MYNWINRLKRELSYYEECNSDGIEMFKAWAKSKKSASAATSAPPPAAVTSIAAATKKKSMVDMANKS